MTNELCVTITFELKTFWCLNSNSNLTFSQTKTQVINYRGRIAIQFSKAWLLNEYKS